MMKNTRIAETTFLFAVSILYAFLVINRWIVTDLGQMSFGRIWQLYVNYFDFGFIRRGLIGTIFAATHLPSLFANEYMFGFFIHHVAVLTLGTIIAVYVLRFGNNLSLLLKVAIFLSPALIIHSGYTTGSLDVYVLIFASLNMLFVRNPYVSAVLIFTGVLVHEASVFTVPAQLMALYIRNIGTETVDVRSGVKLLAAPLAAFLVAMILISAFGDASVPRSEFEATMRTLLPNAVDKHILWSGFFEVNSNLRQNVQSFDKISTEVTRYYPYFALPLFYVMALCSILASNIKSRSIMIAVVAAALTPLLIYFVATEVYRWIALSANMALLLILVVAAEKRVEVGKWGYAAILPFCLVAPFGAMNFDRPFPLHQFILERLM